MGRVWGVGLGVAWFCSSVLCGGVLESVVVWLGTVGRRVSWCEKFFDFVKVLVNEKTYIFQKRNKKQYKNNKQLKILKNFHFLSKKTKDAQENKKCQKKDTGFLKDFKVGLLEKNQRHEKTRTNGKFNTHKKWGRKKTRHEKNKT